nr:proline-rich protein 2-like [Vulpes vulpes]
MERPPGYGAEQGQLQRKLRSPRPPRRPLLQQQPQPRKPQLPGPRGPRKATASWRQVLPGCPWTGAQPGRRAAEPRSPARPRAAGSPAPRRPAGSRAPATASPLLEVLTRGPRGLGNFPTGALRLCPERTGVTPGAGAATGGQVRQPPAPRGCLRARELPPGRPADAAEAGASLERWSRRGNTVAEADRGDRGGGGPPPYLRAPGRAQAPPPGSLIRQRREPTWHRPGDSGLQRPGPAAGPGSVAQEPRAAGPAETGDRR